MDMNFMQCTDANETLEVWNHVDYTSESIQELQSQRGIIKDKQGNTIVRSFGYTEEYTHEQVELLTTAFGNLQEWDFHYAVEGTLLRLFFFQEKWYLSTHKKLDAFKSRWSCKETFGELFQNCLQAIFGVENVLKWFQEQLDPTHVYFFLVRANIQNRIVCHVQNPDEKQNVVFLGHYLRSDPNTFYTYEKGNSLLSVLNSFPESQRVKTPISDITTLCALTESIDPFQYQGIIGFHSSMRTIKVFHSQYAIYAKIRGNNPNLRFRYLELRNDPEKVKLLYVLYPKYTILFDEYESTLYNIARMIYHYYVHRYIKNQYITLPREEYLLLKKCHQWYMEDRKNNRIFTKKVLELMTDEPPLHLYKMIRRFHLDKGQSRHRIPLYGDHIEVPVARTPKYRFIPRRDSLSDG